jgi:hypothetical protein
LFPPNFGLISFQTGWRNTWTHIVAGKFSKSPYSGLLFYEQSTGYVEFYETDGQGGMNFLRSHSDWPKSWTHIISGAFFGPDRTGLLFYDQQAGYAVICDTADGNLVNVREHSGWRPSWTHITTVRLPGAYCYNSAPQTGHDTAVVLYDQAAGRGEIHRCNASGELELIMESDGWRTSWTHVVGDSVAGNGLLFYEGSTTHGEIYTISHDEKTNRFQFDKDVAVGDGLPQATDIIPGNFGWLDIGFLFYDRSSGQGRFVYYDTVTDPASIIPSDEVYTDWRTSWDVIVPGDFWTADPEDVKFRNGFTDLLFYDRANGYGEFYFHDPFESVEGELLEGYASPESVEPGNTVNFYVNSRVGPYTIKIFRQDQSEDGALIATVDTIQQFPQLPIGRLDYRDGPTWPPVAELVIPQDWPSGLYLARAETSQGSVQASYSLLIPFVVRAAIPGSQSRILVFIPNTTYEAYNFWGGRSLYGLRSMGTTIWTDPTSGDPRSPRAFRVAFARPYRENDQANFPIPKWQHWEVPFIRWLARQGIAVEFCTATDLHKDWANHAGLLQNYRLLVSVGHDEYWSKEMRDNVENFAAQGGNVAFFSGNVCFWQIRFDLNVDRQICYKDSNSDPYAMTHPELTTVHWYDGIVCRPSTSLTGLSWNTLNQSPMYRVRQPHHWVFQGLHFSRDSWFGLYVSQNEDLTSVVNTGETDTSRTPEFDGCSGPTPCFGATPSNFLTLAEAPQLDLPGNPGDPVTATMGILPKGKGQVFTVGAVNWTLGLGQDGGWNEIDQITLNVLSNLGEP